MASESRQAIVERTPEARRKHRRLAAERSLAGAKRCLLAARLELQGETPEGIARELGVSVDTVRATQRSKRYHAVRDDLVKARLDSGVGVPARLQSIAPAMVDVIHGIATDEMTGPGYRLAAAKDILDRAGYGAVQKSQSVVMHGVFTAEDLAMLRARREARRGTYNQSLIEESEAREVTRTCESVG